MFNTVKQIHVAIDVQFQQLASNRKRSFEPEMIDHVYNMEMLKYISTRSNPKTNIKQEGREATIKRAEDLKDIKSRSILPCFIDSPNLAFADLPPNYREFKDVECNLIYACRGFKKQHGTSTIVHHISILPFIDSDDNEKFKDFKIEVEDAQGNIITIFDIGDYGNYSTGFHSNDAKFEIINLLLDSVVLNNKNIDIYWESYGSEYHKNSFILVDRSNTYTFSTISYNTHSNTVGFIVKSYDRILIYNESDYERLRTSGDLIASENISEILGNTMLTKNRYLSPIIELEGSRLLIHHDNKFVPKNVMLRYDKKPIFMNYKAGILPSLLDRANEIINMTVSSLAIIASGSMEGLINQSQITE